jgi:hypothetical protein
MRKRKKKSGNVVRDGTRGDDSFSIETVYAGTDPHVKPAPDTTLRCAQFVATASYNEIVL